MVHVSCILGSKYFYAYRAYLAFCIQFEPNQLLVQNIFQKKYIITITFFFDLWKMNNCFCWCEKMGGGEISPCNKPA